MRLKDWSLANKLITGFGFVLLLIVAVSATCLTHSNTTLHYIEKVMFANNLNNTILKLEVDHLHFLAESQKIIAGRPGERINASIDDRKCRLGKWLYGSSRSQLEDLLPHLVPIIKKLEQPHTDLHQYIQKINTDINQQGKESALEQVNTIITIKTEQTLMDIQEGLAGITSALDDYIGHANSVVMTTTSSMKRQVLVLTILAICIGTIACWFIIGLLTGSVKKIMKTTGSLAAGNLTVRSNILRKDEIGLLAAATDKLAEQFDLNLAKVRGSSSTIGASTKILNSLAENMSTSAKQMAGRSTTVAAAAEEMNANMTAIAAASEETSSNVSVVAAAAEEMSSTIGEIAETSEMAIQITGSAVEEAAKAEESVRELGSAAHEINKVTESINEIADQTNLLALNATIEAARAGQAGKGFAVVANEIKELAKQTTEATREIKRRIDSVQSSSEQTIGVINTIAVTINKTNEIVSAMAASFKEQALVSREISDNVRQASMGIQEVNENIAQASMVNREVANDVAIIKVEADGVAAHASDMTELSAEMQANVDTLDDLVAQFTLRKERFHIGEVKAAHFNWKMKLTSIIAGYEHMSEKDVVNHHQCAFGKWYDHAPSDLQNTSIFSRLGTHHKAVHQKIREAIALQNQGNITAAHQIVEEFEVERKQLFATLDELYVSS